MSPPERILLSLGLVVALHAAARGGPAPAARRPRLDPHGVPLPAGALARMGTVKARPPGPVAALIFSPDGERLFSAGPDGTVRAWEAATGKELDTFEQGQAVTGLALSPDGRLLAAATYGWLSVWDVAGRRESLRLGGVCRAVAFSAAGRLTAVREGGVVQARDAERGRIARTFPTGSLYTHLSPDGKAVASLDMGMTTFTDMPHPYPAGPIRLWATATGKQLRVFGKEPGPAPGLVRLAGLPGAGPRRVSFSPDGRLLAWFDGAGKFRAAEAATGQEIEPLAIPDGLYQFSPDGRTLALRAGKRPIELLELATARVRQRIAVDQEPVSCMAFSPDGKTLAVGRADCTILIWDATARPRGAPRALDALWADLAAPDAARAYEAVCALAAAPRQAVPLLEKRLRSPAPDQTDRRIEGLIRDLDDEQFRVRQQAEVGLKELGGRVKSALRAALRGRPSLEVRRRVERLLEELKDARVIPSPQRLRLLRSVEVLERIGDAAARRALARLAARGAADPLSQEAKAALGRLARLPAR